MAASAACKLPTCLCSSPERERINTSYKGQSFDMSISPLAACCARALPLFSVSRRGLANPTSILMCTAAGFEPLAIARPIPLEHRLKLTPVDGPRIEMLRRLVPGERRIRNPEAQELRLRRRDI